MIRVLVLRGLRQHARLLGLSAVGLFLFEWAVVWIADRIDVGAGLRDFLAAILPADVLEIIFGQFGFGSFEGTVSFGFQHPLAIVAGIAMVAVMATIPAQERESGFLDLILARPLPRCRYLAATVILLLVPAFLTPLALLAGVRVGLGVVEPSRPVTWTAYIPSAAALALLLLAIGAYTLLFATDARRRGVAVAQVVGVTLLFYWLDFMGDYWDLLETARVLSPFHYFDPAKAASSGLPAPHALVLSSIACVAVAGAFLNFRRQDL